MKSVLLMLLITVMVTSVWFNLPRQSEERVVLNTTQALMSTSPDQHEQSSHLRMLDSDFSTFPITAPESNETKTQFSSVDAPEKSVKAQLIEQLDSMDLDAMLEYLASQPTALLHYEQLVFDRFITLIFAENTRRPFFKDPLKHADKIAFYKNLHSINDFKVLAAQGDVFAALPLALFYSVSKNTAPAELALKQIYVNVDHSSQLGMLEGIGSLYFKTDPLTAHGYYLLRYQGNYGTAKKYYEQNENLINAAFTLEELQARSSEIASELKERELLNAVGNKVSLNDYF